MPTYREADFLDPNPDARPRFKKEWFRAALERDFNIPVDHPKAAKLFDLAWEEGHADGLPGVAFWYDELAELIRP